MSNLNKMISFSLSLGASTLQKVANAIDIHEAAGMRPLTHPETFDSKCIITDVSKPAKIISVDFRRKKVIVRYSA